MDEVGLTGVRRARRREPARRWSAGTSALIPVDEPYRPRLGLVRHRLVAAAGSSSATTSLPDAARRTCVCSRPASPRSAATRAALPPPGRSSRRSHGADGADRLRRVAGPIDRPIAKATRNGTAVGSLRKVHHSVSVRAVRPDRAERLERPASADLPDQAESRVRPLRRLALMIERPARVRMRARKPCLRARRRVFGW